MIAKTAIGTSVVFLACLGWLGMTWIHGNRTNDWNVVPATVVHNDMYETELGRPDGWATTVRYRVANVDYETVVDEYLIGDDVNIFVDPKDATSVVGKPGARIQSLGAPLIATVGSGLFGLILIMIAIIPKED